MAVGIRVSHEELGLVREALGYMRRRVHGPGDAHLVEELADRTEEVLLAPNPRPSHVLRLGDQHARVLRVVLRAYAAELTRPMSDLSNRARVARLREIDRRLQRAGTWVGRLMGWLGGE